MAVGQQKTEAAISLTASAYRESRVVTYRIGRCDQNELPARTGAMLRR
jgi:hypothetical protein